jgi:hypothetical protein
MLSRFLAPRSGFRGQGLSNADRRRRVRQRQVQFERLEDRRLLSTASLPIPTMLQLTSSANPSVSGQMVIFTATVAPSSSSTGGTTSTVTGSVSFQVGSTMVSEPLSGGKASYTTTSLLAGASPYAVSASYAGTTLFGPSNASLSPSQTVNTASTKTSLSYSGSFIIDQPVTLNAYVYVASPGSGKPSGMVTFEDNGNPLSTTPSSLIGSTASLSLPNGLGVGSHSITAVYSGDSSFTGSTSNTLGPTITKVATTTKLTSSANPVGLNNPVTLTATVTPATTSTSLKFPALTGAVEFYDGSKDLGPGTVTSAGVWQLSTSFSLGGEQALGAVYSGDTTFNTSTGTLGQLVTIPTSMQVSSSVNPSVSGQSVTFTAVVTADGSISSSTGTNAAGGTPTTTVPTVGGTVTFQVGATTVTETLSGGKATYTTTSLLAANSPYSVSATFAGTSLFGPSNASLSPQQTVNKASTTTYLSYSGSFIIDQPVTLNAYVYVASPGSGKPTGTVTFEDNGNPLSTTPSSLSGSTASLSLPNGLGVGSHSITAVYSGDSNFTGSTSNTLSPTVALVSTTTKLTSSANRVGLNNPVTLTATVTPATTSTSLKFPALSGAVEFYDGSSDLGPGTTTSTGVWQLSTSFSIGGSHALKAVYSGDSTYATSTGRLGQLVTIPTSMQLSASANPSVSGQSVTFTAIVTADGSIVSTGTNASGGTPTTTVPTVGGSVTFQVGATTVTETLSGGKATYTTTSLLAANSPYSVSASFAGTSLFGASNASLSPQQTVNKASTTTYLSYTGSFLIDQSVTLNAHVYVASPGAGQPTGGVTFEDNGMALNTTPIALSGSTASLTLSGGLGAGSHSITAVYTGDTNFATSTSNALNPTVALISTTTALTSSVNPVVVGNPVTLTATVTPARTSTSLKFPALTGAVEFYDGSTDLGPGTPTSTDVWQLSTSFSTPGSHSLKAVYSGDSTYATSTGTLSQSVSSTLTTAHVYVTSSASPALVGQAITFSVAVYGATSETNGATGTVTLMDGSHSLDMMTLTGNKAIFTISSLSAGAHAITAVYSGDSNFTPATSSALSEYISPTGTISGMGTLEKQQYALDLDVQSSVTGGVPSYSLTTLTFSDVAAGDTFTATKISSIVIYQPTLTPAGASSEYSSYFSIAGSATLNGGTTAYNFTISVALPAPGTAGSTAGFVTIKVTGPGGFSYSRTQLTPWDSEDITVTT